MGRTTGAIRRGRGVASRERMRWDLFRAGDADVAGPRAPEFQLREEPDAYLFRARLPGLREEDVELSVLGDRLTIATRGLPGAPEAFGRSFLIPPDADPERIRRERLGDELTVVLPKHPELTTPRVPLARSGTGSFDC